MSNTPLTEILDEVRMCPNGRPNCFTCEEAKAEAKLSIRKELLEMVGENEKLEIYPANSNVNTKRRGRNQLRAELRQKITEWTEGK